MKSFFKKAIRNNKGFTLVELLVTIVIFVILTGIVLFNQNSFNNGIVLKNLAYDIALNIKQIQTYGIAVKESQTVSNFSSYGIYFDLANNKNFILFADTGGNPDGSPDGKFNGSSNCPVGDPECIQRYSISRGSYINKICIGLDPTCPTQTQKLTILFRRPNPDAIMNYFDSFGTPATSTLTRIIISSAGNSTTSVIVTNSGQIYVSN